MIARAAGFLELEAARKVLIMPDKDNKGNDLILMEESRARSMRSTTELVNNLLKSGVTKNELNQVFNFMKRKLVKRVESEEDERMIVK